MHDHCRIGEVQIGKGRMMPGEPIFRHHFEQPVAVIGHAGLFAEDGGTGQRWQVGGAGCGCRAFKIGRQMFGDAAAINPALAVQHQAVLGDHHVAQTIDRNRARPVLAGRPNWLQCPHHIGRHQMGVVQQRRGGGEGRHGDACHAGGLGERDHLHAAAFSCLGYLSPWRRITKGASMAA